MDSKPNPSYRSRVVDSSPCSTVLLREGCFRYPFKQLGCRITPKEKEKMRKRGFYKVYKKEYSQKGHGNGEKEEISPQKM